MKETKPLTEEKLRQIIREEIAKIPPVYIPIVYPQPVPQVPNTPNPPYQPWQPTYPKFTCQSNEK